MDHSIVVYNPHIDLKVGVGLPVPCQLSFLPVVEYLENLNSSFAPHLDDMRRNVLDEIRKIPELLKPITSQETLEKNERIIQSLLSIVFPVCMGKAVSFAATIPFTTSGFFSSHLFRERFLDENNRFLGDSVATKSTIAHALLHTILTTAYQAKIPEKRFLELFQVKHKTTQTPTFQHLSLDLSHCRAEITDNSGYLNAEDIARIINLMHQPQQAFALLPLKYLKVSGIVIVRGFDVTKEEAFNRLKEISHKVDTPQSLSNFQDAENLVRIMCQNNNLSVSIMARQDHGWLRINSIRSERTSSCGYGTFLHESEKVFDAILNSNFHEKPYKVLNVEPKELQSDFYKSRGYQTVVILPLYDSTLPIGYLELASTSKLHAAELDREVLSSIAALFEMALIRINNRIKSQIDTYIKENCTSIHPSVEWRFRDAARYWLTQKSSLSGNPLQHIKFDNVFPLYAICDIRGSSKHRSEAIKKDLFATIESFQKIFESAAIIKHFDLLLVRLDELRRLNSNLISGLTASAEVAAMRYIRHDLEPLLEVVRHWHPDINQLVEGYQNALNRGTHNSIDNARQIFDHSVDELNLNLGRHLDKKQEEVQRIYPHYFEKHVTDGIDHSIYIGDELSPRHPFFKSYVNNLRLWQVNVMCDLGKIAHQVGKKLPIHLVTSQLIVAQDSPMTIEFRYDEKRFDVKGAYNIRYELIKKRIDKATIMGRGDRLTEPGTLSVVYSQEAERSEYLLYLNHLAQLGIMTSEPEDLHIDELQDVSGLRALRGRFSEAWLNSDEDKSSSKLNRSA